MYNNINLKNGTYNKAMKYRMKQKKQLNETKKTDNWKNRTERHRIIMGWDKASRVVVDIARGLGKVWGGVVE